MTGVPAQSNTCSEIQWSSAAWLFASRRAEICDMFTMYSIPVSRAACANEALAAIAYFGERDR